MLSFHTFFFPSCRSEFLSSVILQIYLYRSLSAFIYLKMPLFGIPFSKTNLFFIYSILIEHFGWYFSLFSSKILHHYLPIFTVPDGVGHHFYHYSRISKVSCVFSGCFEALLLIFGIEQFTYHVQTWFSLDLGKDNDTLFSPFLIPALEWLTPEKDSRHRKKLCHHQHVLFTSPLMNAANIYWASTVCQALFLVPEIQHEFLPSLSLYS